MKFSFLVGSILSVLLFPYSVRANISINAATSFNTNSAVQILGPETIRVRISSEMVSLSVQGRRLSIQNKKLSQPIEFSLAPEKLEIHRSNDKAEALWNLKWLAREGDKEYSKEQTVAGDSLVLSGEGLVSQGRFLPEKLFLIARPQQKIDVIAHVPLEEYVASVVASEMPMRWPDEALKAQAVAARSYALATKIERGQFHFDVESTVKDQVYQYFTALERDRAEFKRLQNLVKQTEGFVLSMPQVQILKSFYHADCGGHTLSPKDVWGDGIDSGVVADKFCAERKSGQWQYSMTLHQLGERFKHLGLKPESGPILFDRSLKQNRVAAVIVRQSPVAAAQIPSNDFRRAIGFTRLKSTQFNIIPQGEDLMFQGRGYGHGVGLCQHGSRDLALAGKSYIEILKHYYAKAELRKL